MATRVILRGLSRIKLHVSDMVEDVQNTGIMIARRRGEGVVLTEGPNEVDEAFWRQWAEQNSKSALLTGSYLIEDK